jgi:hypothetical protein
VSLCSWFEYWGVSMDNFKLNDRGEKEYYLPFDERVALVCDECHQPIAFTYECWTTGIGNRLCKKCYDDLKAYGDECR